MPGFDPHEEIYFFGRVRRGGKKEWKCVKNSEATFEPEHTERGGIENAAWGFDPPPPPDGPKNVSQGPGQRIWIIFYLQGKRGEGKSE